MTNPGTSGSGPSNPGTSGTVPSNPDTSSSGAQGSSSTGVEQGSSSNPSNSKRPLEGKSESELPPKKQRRMEAIRVPKKILDLPPQDNPAIPLLSKSQAREIIREKYDNFLNTNPDIDPDKVCLRDIGIGGQKYWAYYSNSPPINDPVQKFLNQLKVDEAKVFFDTYTSKKRSNIINTTITPGQIKVKNLIKRLEK